MPDVAIPYSRATVQAFIEGVLAGEIDAPVSAAETLIELLDQADGDPDLEPCAAGDDGLHYFRADYREGWGYWTGDGVLVPEYGADQSQPPLNFRGGYHAPWGA